MAGISVLVLLGLLAACVVVVVLLLQFLARASLGVGGDDPLLREGLGQVRRRFGGCLVAALLIVIGGVVLNGLLPGWLGIPLTLAPGLAASVALLGFAVWPTAPQVGTGSTSASLIRRSAWSFGSRRLFAVPATVAAVYLGALATAAVVASPDDAGLMRAFAQTQGNLSSSATPFPGSFYGLPLAAMTIVVVVSAYAALRRMASSASILPSATEDLLRIDQQWRRIVTIIIVRISAAALLGYLGVTLVYAGSAMHRASDFTVNGGSATSWSAVGWVAAIAGLVSVLATAVLSGAAIAAVLSLRDQAVRPSGVPVGQSR